MPETDTFDKEVYAARSIYVYKDPATGLKFRVDILQDSVFVHVCPDVRPFCCPLHRSIQVYPEGSQAYRAVDPDDPRSAHLMNDRPAPTAR